MPLWYLIGIRHPYGLLGAWAAGLLGWAAAWELVRSLRRAFLPTLGAHLSHLGIAVVALGIVGSKGEIWNEFTYEPGAKANISGINFEPGEAREYTEAGKHMVFEVPMAVSTGERMGTELEFVIMVIAVSCVKLLSAHNSTQHTSRKHKV
jgi:hypothetical protein